MFSNICQVEYIQKLEISYEFDVHLIFTPMYGGFTDYKTRIGGRSHSSTTDTLLAFYTNKTKHRNKPIVIYACIGP